MELYLHFPFCKKKCAYCDFTSYANCGEALVFSYLTALKREIRFAGERFPEARIDTVYLGGGTPSLLSAKDIAGVFGTLSASFPHYAPEDVIALREKLNLTQEALAVLLRVSPKTVLRWETKGEEIPSTACIALCILDKLGDGVFDLMRDDAGSYTLIESLKEQKSDLTAGINDSLYNLSLRDKQILPEPFDKTAVQELRSRLRMSRREFADLLEVSPSTVDKWESGAVVPKGPSLTVMKILWLKGTEALPK